MGNFRNNLFNKLSVFVIISILPITIVCFFVKKYKLSNNHRFTIGIPFNYKINSETSNDLEYFFIVNKERYEGNSPGLDWNMCNRCLINKRFFVKFNPEDPRNSELLLDYPVSDTIKEAPIDGWDNIPNVPDWQQPK